MKHRFALVITSLLFHFTTHAQLWPGYETGRFAGVSSANTRPGTMAPMAFKVDATLFGVHVNTDPGLLFSKDIIDVVLTGGFKDLAGFSQLSSNKYSVFSNNQGPSVMVSATEKVTIAFAWNTRNMWLSNMTDPGFTSLFDKENDAPNLSGNNETANILYTGWNEFALGAGGQVFKEDFNSFSVGGFAKLVFGTGHMSINGTNMTYSTNADRVTDMSLSMQADISDNLYGLVDDGRPSLVDKAGYAFDLGAEYRHLNPRSCPGASNFMINAGFSLTDIGKVKYSSVQQYTEPTATTGDVSVQSFRGETFRATTDSLTNIFGSTPTAKTDFSEMLPMSLRAYANYNIRRRGIIYGELQLMFVQLVNPELPMFFRFNITPRFEDDRFGIYVPLTFSNYVPADAGLAIRLKPLIIGSGNLFTFWAYDDRGTPLDFYITLKVPIIHDSERIDWRTMGKRMNKRI